MNKVLSIIIQGVVLPSILVCATLGFMGGLHGTFSVREIIELCIFAVCPLVLWSVTGELYKTEKITLETAEVIKILGLGTFSIILVVRAMYHYRFINKTGDPLDVIPWGMVAWLALIFMTLGYAQLKKPKKEEVKKEE